MPSHVPRDRAQEEQNELEILVSPAASEQTSNPLRPAQATCSTGSSSPPDTVNTQVSEKAGHSHSDITNSAWPDDHVIDHHDESTRRENLIEEQGPIPYQADDPTIYPGPLSFFLLMLGISLAAFVVALDRTIVATAIPQITDSFHSPEDVGWFGSAYLLTSCAFQPTYGRVFAHFDVRGSFLVALGLFEVGSLICGVAQSAVMLVIGRAIAGLGCAGVFSGVMVIITLAVPLVKRPVYMGFVGSMFGIGAVCGPIIGGALTSKATWRWCFYLNLPVGLITFLTLVFFFRPQKVEIEDKKTLRKRLLQLDPIGNLLLITAVVMLLLALQWGGTKYAWSESKIVGLLVGAGVMSIIFILWQLYRGQGALIPPKVISQRTVASSSLMGFFLSGALLVESYYVPYWFQAIKNETAITSGVDTIPYLASNFVCTMIAGFFVTKSGYFNPPAILGGAIATVGCGLITLYDVDTPTGRWIGYLIIAGGGIGFAVQQGIVAVQAVLPQEVVPIATSLVLFAQSLAGAIFVSVGSSLLRNRLESGLEAAHIPGVDVTSVLAAGATQIKDTVPEVSWPQVMQIYNDALDKVFVVAVPLAGLGMICAMGMEWKSIKPKKST